MVVLGLLLMLGCTALAVDAVVQNSAALSAVAFNQHISGLSVGATFIAGAVLGLLFALGMAMFVGGITRSARIRRDRRRLRKENAQLAAKAQSTATYPAEATTTAPNDASETTTTTSTTSGRHRMVSS